MANRIKNSANNIASGLGLRLILLLLQFGSKTFFVRYLSAYLGISSLLTSILSYLNITELGIGTAINFAMYKPIAEGDQEKVRQYIDYYKKVYRVLGFVTIAIGVGLAPFLPLLIQMDEVNMTYFEIYVIYALYTINACYGYFIFAYREGFIEAAQKAYRLTPINYTANVLAVVFQVVGLVVCKGNFIGFAVYTGAPIIVHLIARLLFGIFAAKWYPYIKDKPEGKLSKPEKKDIFKNVYGVGIDKICIIINNSVDSIIISAVIGISVLGYYSLYFSLISMLAGFVSAIYTAMIPSVGNLGVEADVAYKKKIFNVIYFTGVWLYGFCAISYVVIVQPFMAIWAGADKLLGIFVPIIVALNFLTLGMTSPVGVFRSGCGLYFKGRHRPIIYTILNIGFSILIGYFFNFYFGEVWGIFGIVLATIVSRMSITWWFDGYIVFKYVFNEKVWKYLGKYLIDLLTVGVIGGIIFAFCELLNIYHVWPDLIVRVIVCLVLVNLLFFAVYGRKEEFRYLTGVVKNLFKRKSKRVGKEIEK